MRRAPLRFSAFLFGIYSSYPVYCTSVNSGETPCLVNSICWVLPREIQRFWRSLNMRDEGSKNDDS